MATTEPSSEPVAVIESAAQPPSQMQFDYTNPASWEALGKQWSMTYGYTPSPEEMMQYVMMGGVVNANSAGGNGTAGWSNSGYENESTEMYNRNSRGGRGRGGYSRGRGGGYGRGNPRDTQGMDTMDTDAIVLGGDTDTTPMAEQPPVQHHPQQASGNSGGAGGRMQRVGDKWVFVRS
ncbi:hypothetical protein ONZ45_g18496 [Pleurotus djamor]|nr:hypothetical protein ONZ45_g18496 [Pleurotus djamor]